MITSCIIFLATFGTPTEQADQYYLDNYFNCKENVPVSMWEYAPHYYEHFDIENINTAVRIGWCESRGKKTAHRNDNGDSGVMQFVSWTWNWVAEEYDIPMWDEWVIMRWDKPYTENKTYKHNIGFEQTKVQFTPYYNIYMASLLAEDIYGRTQWRDWNSSKWCWEDEKKWHLRWTSEN